MSTPANHELYIAFDPEKCTQCHGCQTACKTWRALPYGVLNRRVLNLWEGNYPIIRSSSLSIGCLHCVNPACINVCEVEAIIKRTDNGLVEVNSDLCIGCQSCYEACPYDVPQFDTDGIMLKCDLCFELLLIKTSPPCVATCPGKALTLADTGSSEKLLHEQTILKLYDLSRRP